MTKLTTLGPNSAIINYSSESNVVVSNAIRNWLIEHGWTLHDQVSTSVFVLKAPNLDGVTYKYVYFGVNGNVYIRAFESWNATTHVGTNGTYPAGGITSDSLAVQTNHSTVSGKIYIFATARYLVLLAELTSGGGGSGLSNGVSPLGVFEFTRDDPDDTVALGLPCYVQFDFGSGSGNSIYVDSNASSRYQVVNTFLPCRTAKGYTGAIASLYTRLSTPIGSWGFSYSSSTYVNSTWQVMLEGSSLSATYGFPSGKNSISGQYNAYNITIIEDCDWSSGYTSMTVRGKFCGLKLLNKSTGVHFDTIPIKTLSETLLADKNGVNMDHIVLSATSVDDVHFALPL